MTPFSNDIHANFIGYSPVKQTKKVINDDIKIKSRMIFSEKTWTKIYKTQIEISDSFQRLQITYKIINLEDAADRFCGEGEGTDGHQQRLNDQLFKDVRDPTLCEIHVRHTLKIHACNDTFLSVIGITELV